VVELSSLRDYQHSDVELVETFEIPSTQTKNLTQDTDELTFLGRRLGRTLVEPFIAAWQNNLSYDGKVKRRHVRVRGGRAEITKQPTEALTRSRWKNDCNTLATLLRTIFLRNGQNPPYMDDLVRELQTAKSSWYNKRWFRVFIRYNLAFKSSLCRAHVSYDIIRMYDELPANLQTKFQKHLNSVKVPVWTNGTAQLNYLFRPTCQYRIRHSRRGLAYPKTGFGCFTFQRNFSTHPPV
jgi:hypothetical protein